MQGQQKYTVLIVDDSASARQTLCDIIGSDPELVVMGTARDPYKAAELIRRQVPDVIFLDIELPRMDGLTFLRKLMAQRPIPVVVCSSLTEKGSAKMMEALEAGAIDVVSKPRIDTVHFLHESRIRICDAAKAAAQARLRPRGKPLVVEAKLSVDVILPKANARTTPIPRGTQDVVCIGASTGGTEALRVVLGALPADAPGIVVVQHMPAKFTAAFASRLNTLCEVEVREAQDGDPVLPGCVLIAPGDHHMLLQRVGTRYRVSITDGPPVSRHRPSVDVLFRSATLCAGPNAAGFLLTGMGDDGAQGLLEMRQAGAFTVAQDEESCVVFGMPNEAIRRGAACKVLPLDRIARAIMDHHRIHAAEIART